MKSIIQIKNITPLILLCGIIAFSFVSNKSNVKPRLSVTEKKMMFLVSTMSMEDIKTLSPSSLEKITGHELSWKETIALKKVKKYMSASDQPSEGSSKSQGTAFLLCWFLGLIGIHRFYLGYKKAGLIQLFTLGGCGIWTLIDFIKIIQNKLPASDGSKLTHWFD